MTRLVPRPDWTPEEFVRAVWEIAECRQGNVPLHLTYQAAEVLALFRPAEEPESTPGIRCGMGQEWDNSACYRLARWQSVDGKAVACDKHRLPTDVPIQVGPAPAPAAPCDHPAEDCLPEMTVGPRYGHLRCLRCGAFISHAPAAPPPAGEPEENDPAIASALMSMDDFVLVKRDALARVSRAARTLRAENERLTGAIRDAGWAITGDERHVCPQCKPGLVQDAARPPEGGTER